jgi:hypothetical protein
MIFASCPVLWACPDNVGCLNTTVFTNFNIEHNLLASHQGFVIPFGNGSGVAKNIGASRDL